MHIVWNIVDNKWPMETRFLLSVISIGVLGKNKTIDVALFDQYLAV